MFRVKDVVSGKYLMESFSQGNASPDLMLASLEALVHGTEGTTRYVSQWANPDLTGIEDDFEFVTEAV